MTPSPRCSSTDQSGVDGEEEDAEKILDIMLKNEQDVVLPPLYVMLRTESCDAL